MSVLVLAEHNNQSLKEATKKAVTAALKISSPAHLVVIGNNCDSAANDAATLEGVEKVYQFGHIADGNIHFIVGKLNHEDALRESINNIVYGPLKEMGGSVSAEHGIGEDKKAYLALCRSEAEINLMKVLKKALDPKSILNRGKVFDH